MLDYNSDEVRKGWIESKWKYVGGNQKEQKWDTGEGKPEIEND